MRDLKKIKQIRHYNFIPSDLLKWVFLNQTKMVFSERKTFPNANDTSNAME